MTVDVVLYAGAVTPERVVGRSAAVIDVLRATSVIVEALHNGAQAVIPVVTVEEALLMRDKVGCENSILGGEREMVRVDGFDQGNSPRSYTPQIVRGKKLILSTTNGTRAILNSRHARHVYISSMLNMGAVCEALAEAGTDVVLVCSGRKDMFTTEDGLCAGAIAGILTRKYGYENNDIAEVMMRMYDAAKDDLPGRLSTSRHYNDLLEKGFGADIDFCLQRDIYDIAPYYNTKGDIIL